jgi:hypothetical protein
MSGQPLGYGAGQLATIGPITRKAASEPVYIVVTNGVLGAQVIANVVGFMAPFEEELPAVLQPGASFPPQVPPQTAQNYNTGAGLVNDTGIALNPTIARKAWSIFSNGPTVQLLYGDAASGAAFAIIKDTFFYREDAPGSVYSGRISWKTITTGGANLLQIVEFV